MQDYRPYRNRSKKATIPYEERTGKTGSAALSDRLRNNASLRDALALAMAAGITPAAISYNSTHATSIRFKSRKSWLIMDKDSEEWFIAYTNIITPLEGMTENSIENILETVKRLEKREDVYMLVPQSFQQLS